jgi:hypothetical protein
MNLQGWTELHIAAGEEDLEEEDDLEDDDEDSDDEDEEDDEVGTDEAGREMLNAPAETLAQPDVTSDRKAPGNDASARHAPINGRKPPLAIREIEDLEDDAPGG